MSYELLSEPLRRYIRDKRWEEFRPIQAAAISKLLTTSENYILASKTASVLPEAVFEAKIIFWLRRQLRVRLKQHFYRYYRWLIFLKPAYRCFISLR